MDNRIRELRNEKGLRQEDLAGILNVSQQTISRIENGENSLPADILIDLSKFFRVSADYILKLSDARMTREYRIEAEKSLEKRMDFYRMYERLNRTNQEFIDLIMLRLEECQKKSE
ncbi:MAG TPA: helix-turn-helix domain-containing protein [Candidatus Mediterraneibacter colneyensis]|nr:helix-turn-helix domain-containing protein [Candidatus Mediterraneibacter colneyensis]